MQVAFCTSVCKGLAFTSTLEFFQNLLLPRCICDYLEINMTTFVLAVASFLAVCAPALATQCSEDPVSIPKEWVTMQKNCTDSMRQQIQMEVAASVQYLAMGAHFSQDTVNRPGFAKLFFDAGSEEREHALKLIEYMLMRGELTSDVTSLITVRHPERNHWANGVEALEHALKMEHTVTDSIRKVIHACESDSEFNDYHLVDYLTADFLEEQYKGQRDLAGKASTLKKMLERHPSLGEFIFDKKLLGMDI